MQLALGLGADVPFLATDAPLALGWGRGERLLALRSLPAREVQLAMPPFGVETAAAFGWYAQATGSGIAAAPAPISLDNLDRWDGIIPLAENDLEAVVTGRHPEIAECVRVFRESGARIARMSGSGSTAFGVFDRRLMLDAGQFPEGTRLVQTRTLTSVAPVKLLD
jgi:4-diphosphocytidyl-2-C-methyl-D-erythritol kinase